MNQSSKLIAIECILLLLISFLAAGVTSLTFLILWCFATLTIAAAYAINCHKSRFRTFCYGVVMISASVIAGYPLLIGIVSQANLISHAYAEQLIWLFVPAEAVAFLAFISVIAVIRGRASKTDV